MAIPDSGLQRMKRVVSVLEGGCIHMWGTQKPAVKPIGPAVIWALDTSGQSTFCSGTQAGPAVAAHIVKGLYRARFTADDNNAFSGYLAKEVIARITNAVGVSGAEPGFEKEDIDLAAIQVGICIVVARQCFRNGTQRLLLPFEVGIGSW